jgi:hypothetical protein
MVQARPGGAVLPQHTFGADEQSGKAGVWKYNFNHAETSESNLLLFCDLRSVRSLHLLIAVPGCLLLLPCEGSISQMFRNCICDEQYCTVKTSYTPSITIALCTLQVWEQLRYRCYWIHCTGAGRPRILQLVRRGQKSIISSTE